MAGKQRITRYCIICNELVEDRTRCNNKVVCDKAVCIKKKTQLYNRKYMVAYKKKNSVQYQDSLLKSKIKNKRIPIWSCQVCGFKKQLDFDPRRWQNTKLLLGLSCDKCNEQKTDI